jgi:hypothetical protein
MFIENTVPVVLLRKPHTSSFAGAKAGLPLSRRKKAGQFLTIRAVYLAMVRIGDPVKFNKAA